MYSYVAALAFAGSASALVVPRQDGCCFEMKASGDQSGTIGQLDDGQNRIGGGLSPATYCINDGAITDSNGRGCILTPPTTQFQCDEGATPTSGFSVSGEGEIQYNGSNKFYACGADQDEYNIYTVKVEGQEDCVEVTLSSSEGKCSNNGGGGGEGASSSASAPAGSSAASSKPASGQSTAPAESGASKPSSSAPASSPATGADEKPSNSAPQGYNSQPATSAAQTSAPAPSAPAESAPSAPAPSAPAPAPSAPGQSAPSAPAPSAPAPAPSAPAESAPAECRPETKTVTVTQPCAGSQETGNTGVGGGSPAPSDSGSGSGSSPSSYGSPQPSGGAGQSSYGNSKPSSGAETSKAAQPSGNVPYGGASSAEASKPAASTPAGSTAVQSTAKPSQPAGNTAPGVGSSSKAVPSAGTGSGSPATSSKPDSASGPAPYPTGSSAQASSAPAGTGSGSEGASRTQGTGTASGSACQTDLSGAYQTPHLIVPVSSEQPDQAYGTSYNGQINETTSTIFNFDIPQDYEGKQCSIIFLFPKKKDLETSSYEFGGSGSLSCSELSSAADEQTSYSNAPSVKNDLGTVDLKTGNSYVVATQDCKAGTTQSIELSSENGLSLNFFEDWNPSPLGLYITSC